MRYNLISKFYDILDVFYFNKYETSHRKYILENIEDKSVALLDICVGTGSNAIFIAENRSRAQIFGIDISTDMLDIAKSKIEKRNIKNIELYLMNAANMTFTDESFDIVLVSLVLHEISETDRNSVLKEVMRLLKDKGKAIVVEWEKPKSFFKKIFFMFIKMVEDKYFSSFLKKDLSSLLLGYGFCIASKSHADYTKIFICKKLK